MSNIQQTFSIPVEALGLSNIEIIKVVLNTKNEFIFTVKSTNEKIPCHRCGRPTEPHGTGQAIRLRHLPILGKKTYIEITPPRGRCSSCDDNPTTTQQANWYARKSPHTKAYEQHVLLSLVNSTITDVSIKEDIGYQSIQAMVDRQIATEVNWRLIKEIGLLGVDEISLKKGHRNFVTLVTSRTANDLKILAVLKGHEKETIKAFFRDIPKRLRKTIVAVCTDMHDGFVNASKEVLGKQIPIIIDRFHVVQLYRKSLASLRKRELRCLKKVLSVEEYLIFKPAISILYHSKEFMTPEEKKIVEPLFEQAPLLKITYQFCCKLTGIYNSHVDPIVAHEKMNAWITEVESSELICFNRFIKTLKKYQTEIENYFIGRETSGFVEGINNKAKVLKRRCYGIFNLKHFFQRLFLDFSGYKHFARIKEIAYA